MGFTGYPLLVGRHVHGLGLAVSGIDGEHVYVH